jgi:hypothetical protein
MIFGIRCLSEVNEVLVRSQIPIEEVATGELKIIYRILGYTFNAAT